jgi:hypothetical protein
MSHNEYLGENQEPDDANPLSRLSDEELNAALRIVSKRQAELGNIDAMVRLRAEERTPEMQQLVDELEANTQEGISAGHDPDLARELGKLSVIINHPDTCLDPLWSLGFSALGRPQE